MTAKEYLTTLTLDEKIRLLNGNGSWKSFDAGGKIPFFLMSDGPHGLRKQEQENYADLNKSKMATCFPTASSVASSWNIEAVKKMSEAIADEALAEDVDIVLGCGINIKRSPLCGRNFEYFSEDPFLAGTLSSAYISSMEKKGVGTSLKHFACNNQETRRQTSNSIIDLRTLHEIYLKAFELSVRHGNPTSIMASYNRLNGEYTCCSKYLLTDVLRRTWGFRGIVISDWGACIDASSCVRNGMDLAMPDSHGYLTKNIYDDFRSGKITEEEIDSAAIRILENAIKFGSRGNKKNIPLTIRFSTKKLWKLQKKVQCFLKMMECFR